MGYPAEGDPTHVPPPVGSPTHVIKAALTVGPNDLSSAPPDKEGVAASLQQATCQHLLPAPAAST